MDRRPKELLFLVLGLVHLLQALGDNVIWHGDPREVLFPGPVAPARSARSDNELMRSLARAKQLNKLRSKEEFLKFIGVVPADLPHLGPHRLGSLERSNALPAEIGYCMPESRVVPVKEEQDPLFIYFPNCVRIPRCGGCCNHPLYSCEPVTTEMKNYEITVFNSTNLMREIIPLETHTSCDCLCITKEKDCNEKQWYKADECKCVCKNSEEENKCWLDQEKKYWDEKSCSCQCRKVEECSTGFYYDQNLCSCKSLLFSRHWFNDERKTGYDFRPSGRTKESPPVIVTLDAADPRRKHREDPEYK